MASDTVALLMVPRFHKRHQAYRALRREHSGAWRCSLLHMHGFLIRGFACTMIDSRKYPLLNTCHLTPEGYLVSLLCKHLAQACKPSIMQCKPLMYTQACIWGMIFCMISSPTA